MSNGSSFLGHLLFSCLHLPTSALHWKSTSDWGSALSTPVLWFSDCFHVIEPVFFFFFFLSFLMKSYTWSSSIERRESCSISVPTVSFFLPFNKYSSSVTLGQVPCCSDWRPYLLGVPQPLSLAWGTKQLANHRSCKEVILPWSEMTETKRPCSQCSWSTLGAPFYSPVKWDNGIMMPHYIPSMDDFHYP